MDIPSVKKNYIYDTLYHVMTFFIPLMTVPYLSRVLGVDGVGTFSYLVSLQTYFSMFTALGTVTYGTRIVAQNRDNRSEVSKLFWEIELLTVVASVVTLTGWTVMIAVYSQYRIYLIPLTMCILGTVFDISWFFSGLEQYKFIALRNTLFKFLGVILLFLYVKNRDDLVEYFVIYSLVSLLSSLSLWFKLKEFIVRTELKDIQIKGHIRETLIYFVPTIATSIYTVMDKALIGIITKESAQNGYYEQANQIINIAKTVTFGSMNTVLGSRISYLFAQKRYGEIKEKISKAFNYVFVIGYGSVFGVVGVADTFVPLYFGNGFLPVIDLLYILSPIIIIIGISSCLGSQYYIPAGKRSQSAKYLIFGSCLNLVLNLLLIPSLQAKGAAIASIIAELFIAFMYLKHCADFISFRRIIRMSKNKVIAGVVMCIFIRCILGFALNNAEIFTLILQMVIGILVYSTILFILKDSVVSEILKILKRIIKQNII